VNAVERKQSQRIENQMKRSNWIRSIGFVVMLMLLALALVSCNPSGRVERAVAWDWVWGLEYLESGSVRVWFRHDNIAGYCTGDPALVEQIVELGGQPVEFEFERVDWASEENPGFSGVSGCSSLSTGTDSSTPIFKITSIELAPHMDGGR